jgi:uncharacterized membrane protein
MVVQLSSPSGGCEFRLRPNRSLSRRGVAGFLAGMAAAMLGVALLSAMQGNVYAPGFALLYLALVCGCFAIVQRRLRREERIGLLPGAVTVVRRDSRGEEIAGRFDPYWVRLESNAGRLELGSHGKRVEIGAFLAEDERAELARRLAQALIELRAMR